MKSQLGLLLAAALIGCGSSSADADLCEPDLSIPDEDCAVGSTEFGLQILSLDDLEQFCNSTCTRVASPIAIGPIEGMVDMRAFARIRVFDGLVSIRRAADLRSFEGMERVESIDPQRGFLQIQFNPALESLRGLDNLRVIPSLEIQANDVLRELGMPKLETITAGATIYDNPALPQCEVDAFYERITSNTANSRNNGGTCTR